MDEYRLSDTGSGDAVYEYEQTFSKEQTSEIMDILQFNPEKKYIVRYTREGMIEALKINKVKSDIILLRCIYHPRAKIKPAPSIQKKRISTFISKSEKYLSELEKEFCLLQSDGYNPPLYEHQHSNLYRAQHKKSNNRYSYFYTKKENLLKENDFDKLTLEIQLDLKKLISTAQKVIQKSEFKGKNSKENIEEWTLLCEIGNIYFEHTKTKPKITRSHNDYTNETNFNGDITKLIKIIFEGHRFNAISDEALYKRFKAFEKNNHPKLKFGTVPSWLEHKAES